VCKSKKKHVVVGASSSMQDGRATDKHRHTKKIDASKKRKRSLASVFVKQYRKMLLLRLWWS
jgi:hypothetical protein